MQTVGSVPRRYVASLDVLGFKNLVERDILRLADAYWTAVKITERHQESSKFFPDNPGVVNIDGTPQPGRTVKDFPHIFDVAVFSDSIFIFTEDDSEASLNDLCEFCFCIYRVFLNHLLPLRGAIACGEAIVMREDKVYLGQAINDAHALEQSLDITGIVLAEGLQCAASVEAQVAFKETRSGAGQVNKIMRVPTHRNPLADGKQYARNFQMMRIAAGAPLTQRYRNSESVVAAMMKADQNSLKLTTDPDYVAAASQT